MKKDKHIAIVGGGLVGSLLAIYLRKRHYQVSVFERRPDMRKESIDAGRSINLALSTRGLAALSEIGIDEELKQIAIPMHGRMVHNLQGHLTFLPYGKHGQYINSISRSALNIALINKAEKAGATFFFNHKCSHIDLDQTTLTLSSPDKNLTVTTDHIVGADGAFSAVRVAMQVTDRFDYTQQYLEHGYKELHIPAEKTGGFRLEKNALHIWPRESFMMIALPNPNGSFTCTLFFPLEGPLSFRTLNNNEAIVSFFKENFADAFALMPSLLEDFNLNPTSSLVTIKCFPWVRNNTLLIGDAAHAIVPFYGQGMNAGFEDCSVLNQLLENTHDDWPSVLNKFQENRKPDTDAIAQLALDNFIEMRDLVAEPSFLLRKKIEAKLHELYPDKWIPLYSMVTFNNKIRYSEAYATGQRQKKIMDNIMSDPTIEMKWQQLDFKNIADQLAI